MKTHALDLETEPLTKAQEAAFHMFRKKLERRFPEYSITAVEPLKENMIRVWLESAPETYKKGLAVCKLAVEVEEETGIFIILR